MDHAAAAPDASRICPFLHTATAEGTLGDSMRWPDEGNRCSALGDAAPQSIRQQEYACLTASHVNCPRFVRGVHLMAGAPPPPAGAGLQPTPAVLAALLVLALSAALSVGFVIANRGMNLPVAPGGSATPLVAVASSGPSGSAPPPTPTPSGEPSPAATVETATATPTVASTLASSATPSPAASSNRYALLKPCGDAPDCWVYTIRGGDNLVSIARYFGVPFETVTELNPWTTTTELVAGQELRLPPPTR